MRNVFLIAVLVVLFSSCNMFGGKRVKGNGTIITQDRQVASFNSLDVSGAISVHLKQSPTAAVKIETDENLMEYLEVSVDGNTLKIHPKNGYNLDPSKKVNVYVSATAFKNIDVSGASSIGSDEVITADDMKMDASGASEITLEVKLSKLSADVSGASTLQLKGTAKDLSTEASGASKVLCMGLTVEEAELNISGASQAEVTADKELNIEASGASTVEYKGSANINQKSSGASNVRKV